MLNGRVYRAACLPLLLALVVAGVSFGDRPGPITSALATDAFDGPRTAEELSDLAREFPDRRPGSEADQRLAVLLADKIRGLGSPTSSGFRVSSHQFEGQTIDGERTLTNVVAERSGLSGASPIVIIAHRDAAGKGAEAELSGTAILLELARVFASRETRRTIILVSTSGGSGGDAGAQNFVSSMKGPIDAALVLGDLASRNARRPFVTSFSDALGSAPSVLTRTVESAIAQEVGTRPGAPGLLSQFVHLAFPLTVGEQGPLNAAGVPAVLMQVSGERGPLPDAQISPQRVENFGRAVLNSVDALDRGEDLAGTQTVLLLSRELIPGWALRLLCAALIFPVAILALDALARVLRRREPVRRWAMWGLSCAVPFLLSALLVVVAAHLGVIGARPAAPVLTSAMPVDGSAKLLLVAFLLLLALFWLSWPLLARRLNAGERPAGPDAGVAVMLMLLATTLLVWLVNPFTALLLIPALHLLPLVLAPELRPRRALGLAVIVLSAMPPILLVAFYAHALHTGAIGSAWTLLLLLSGGQFGFASTVLASLFFGALAASLLIALQGRTSTEELLGVSIRGPVSYAGPGSLGGTESAVRR
jgi:Peptidase family M28